MSSFSDPNFTIFGRNPDGVLELLKERKRRETKDDGRKFGLIIEGGGMRGIIAGGMLVALHESLGAEIFDIVYGTSAGALSGAFFLSGQIPYGIAIYYEDLATEKFINLARIPPKFDIDYLINIIEYKRKLDISALKCNATELIIASTDITTGEQHYISSRDNVSILTAIKASCALPLYYDKPVEIEGKKYIDAATAGLTPIVHKALADGCTDVLILLNKQKYRRNREYSKSPFWFNLWRLKWYLTHFKKLPFDNHVSEYRRFLPLIEGKDSISSHVNIAVIAPAKKPFHIATRDAKKLKEAYYTSYRYTLNLLEHLPYDDSAVHLQEYPPLLQPYGVSC